MPVHETSTDPSIETATEALADAQRDRRIFVELALPTASECLATADSAIEQAEHPAQLRFGIGLLRDDQALAGRRDDPRLSIEVVEAGNETDGPPSGSPIDRQQQRRVAQAFYDGEPFLLQVDRPIRFLPGWDRRYCEVLAALDVERPVITEHPLLVERMRATDQRASPAMAAYRFTLGRYCIDVAHHAGAIDHHDIRLAVRAYTEGYDEFAPPDALLVAAPETDNSDSSSVGSGRQDADGSALDAVIEELASAPPHQLGRCRSLAALQRARSAR